EGMTPISRMAQSLRFQQERFASTESLLGLPSIFDVNQQVMPANDVAGGVPCRLTAEMKPSVHTIRPSQAKVEFERTWTIGRLHPVVERCGDLRKVVRMNLVRRPPALDLLERSAKVVEQLTIDEFGLARSGGRADESGEMVNRQTRIELGVPSGLLGFFEILHSRHDAVPTGNVPFGRTPRLDQAVKPVIGSVGSAKTMSEIEGIPRPKRTIPPSPYGREIVRVYQVARFPRSQLLDGPATIFEHSPIRKLELACRGEDVDEGWNCVDRQTKVAFCISCRLLSASAVLDIS